jgi:C4-dicarboxylate-specific signal transduction histidine kinase
MKDLRLSFINRILSSYTHEVRNYLAIIKETNGLMKDVIQIGKSRAVEAKQFLGFIGCVEDQIERAAAITDYLHRFAHRMDCERTTVSINELIEELVALMTRLAYRRRIAFEKELRGGLPSTVMNPILFHYLLFCIIDSRMSCLDRNGIVRIATSFSEGRLRINVSSKGDVLQDGAAELCRNEEINGLAAELGAEISKDGTDMVIKVPIMA